MIGLAGGIASGKSLLAGLFGEWGAAVIDSDRMAHDELADPEVIRTLKSWWGETICLKDGGIDRRAMANVIFDREEERRRLESYLYPRLELRRRTMMSEFQSDAAVKAIVINSPLLYEVGLEQACDAVVFVKCDREEQVRRVRLRGWSDRELARREKVQMPLDEKEKLADYVVVNNAGVDELRSLAKPLFDRLLTHRRTTGRSTG